MQIKTHLALGHRLLDWAPDAGLHRYSELFLLGCMEPDYNLATYLRGLKGHGVFHGHNADNSFAYVSGCLRSFEKNGLGSGWDYFRLGALLHYVADPFTGPHNSFWTGGLISHAVYELRLHEVITREPEPEYAAGCAAAAPMEYFSAEHRSYCAAEPGLHTDSRCITRVCRTLLHTILGRAGADGPAAISGKETMNEH